MHAERALKKLFHRNGHHSWRWCMENEKHRYALTCWRFPLPHWPCLLSSQSQRCCSGSSFSSLQRFSSLSSCSENIPVPVLQQLQKKHTLPVTQGCQKNSGVGTDSTSWIQRSCHLAWDDKRSHYFKVMFELKHSYQFLWQLIVGHRFLTQETS